MAKIVVASYQSELRELLKKNITGITVDVVYNIVEASTHLSHNDFNILIYDIDSGAGATNYLDRLSMAYNLMVILTGSSTSKAMNYIRKGYGEFIIKPENYRNKFVDEYIECIVNRIKELVNEKFKSKTMLSQNNRQSKQFGSYSASARLRNDNSALANKESEIVIAIASSTGGTEALPKILTNLPEDMPPILIVQHFPPNFARFFCQRLDKLCKVNVKLAEKFEYIKRGTVYVADADSHMILKKINGNLAVESIIGKRVNGVMPSADVLFNSVADVMKEKAIGLVLTGMGCDGAKGLYAMKTMGAKTLAQDEKTSLIFGMAKVSQNIGAVDELLPLENIAGKLIKLSK